MKKLQKRAKFNDCLAVVSACNCMGACICGATATVYTQATYSMQHYYWTR